MFSKVVFRLVFFLAALGFASTSFAQKPVRVDSELVTQSTDSVWYDSNNEDIKPSAGGKGSLDVSRRHSSIAENDKKWWLLEAIKNFFSYVRDLLSWTFSAWRLIFIFALISIVALILFLVVRYGVFEGGSYRPNRSIKELSPEEQAVKIKELPFELETSSMTLMEQARRYRDAGDYAKAMMYLFSHLLVDLDHARLIRLARGKTNRVYLRELKPQITLHSLMAEAVSLFEWSFFGKHEISKEKFEAIWDQLPQFEHRLRQSDSVNSTANVVTLLLLLSIGSSSGCWRSLSSEYGVSEGYSARMSPGAVSVLRRVCDRSGRSTKLVRSLSPRSQSSLQSIVWIPDRFPVHDEEVYQWMDTWLSVGDRTLVYIGRDYSPIADYWKQSSEHWESKEPNKTRQVQANRSWASAQVNLDTMRAGCRVVAVTPWCYFDFEDSDETRVKSFGGPWSEDLESKKTRILLRGYPQDLNELTATTYRTRLGYKEPSANKTTSGTATPTIATPEEEYAIKLQTEDEQMLKILADAAGNHTDFTPLLESSDGFPLIAEVTSSKWKGSRVLVVANASVVANIGMVHPGNRSLVQRIVEELPLGSVGFVSGPMEPRIRSDDASEQQKGFEMLTIWPLSMISIHASLLGILALLASFPIFGRPKNLPSASIRDFGQHVDAIGMFLKKSKDRFYALATIGDYFRIVRKDPTSPWATSMPESKDEAKSPFAAGEPKKDDL